MGSNHFDIGLGHDFWIWHQKQKQKQQNQREWHYIKLKKKKKSSKQTNKTFTAKEKSTKWKGNLLRKIFAKHISDKALMFKAAMRSCCVALGTRFSHLWWSMIMQGKKMYTCMCNWVTMLYSRKKNNVSRK